VAIRSLRDFDVSGKRVLVREDLNVPIKDAQVADFTRIDAAIPTLRWLHEHDARTIVLSHLGRPEGKPNPAYSLQPVAQALSDRLGIRVAFADDCVGEVAREAIARLGNGDVLLLENVRFHPEEERNDPAFAAELAALGELYVDDAFGTAHRAHASTEGVAHLLPHAAGFLMEAELQALQRLTEAPAKPFVCVIGGAKVKDKIGVLRNLMGRVDAFCIGGGMANTFLAAQGVAVGKSLRDEELTPAHEIAALARTKHVDLRLPTDAVVAPSLDANAKARIVSVLEIPSDEMILDIGPETAAAYARVIAQCKTIVFNGPMGVYEQPAYRNGTAVVGEAIARATAAGATSVVGGGDAAAAAHLLGFADKVTHVSTGGGATLEFLEGKTLPGIAALER
jgi:phosphoglycerate kinase